MIAISNIVVDIADVVAIALGETLSIGKDARVTLNDVIPHGDELHHVVRFVRTERVVADVMARVQGRGDLRTVILSLEESSDLDSTAVECLLELDQRLRAAGKGLVLTRVKDPVRELLGRWNPLGVGAADRLFWSVADAAAALVGPAAGANVTGQLRQ